jgi:hypothetical protein
MILADRAKYFAPASLCYAPNLAEVPTKSFSPRILTSHPKPPPAAKQKRLHGGTVSTQGSAAPRSRRFYPFGIKDLLNGRFIASDLISA